MVPTIPHAVQCLKNEPRQTRMDGHVGTVSIGGRQLTKLRFADDINGLTSRETELQQLVNRI